MSRESASDDASAEGQAAAGGRKLIDKMDALLALCLIVLCGAFYYVTFDFEAPGAFLGENMLPEQFPRIMLVSIAAMAILLPFEHLVELERWPSIEKSRSAPIGKTIFVTMAFLFALAAVGEYLGTILTIFIAVSVLPLLWGERRYVLVLVYALIFTAVVTYLFSIVLSVFFVPGVFGLTLR